MNQRRPRQLSWAVTAVAILVAVLVPRLLGMDDTFAERLTWGIISGTVAIVLMNVAVILHQRDRE